MPKEKNSKYAVLGMLSGGPLTGYDVRKAIQETISHFWSESFGQIYPMLKELVAEGLATVREEVQSGKPNRKVYQITAHGRAELQRWLVQPVQAPPVRSELCLKLWFGSQVPVEESVRQVERFRGNFAARLATYQTGLAEAEAELRGNPDGLYYLLTIRMGEAIAAACVDWADRALADLARLQANKTSRRKKHD